MDCGLRVADGSRLENASGTYPYRASLTIPNAYAIDSTLAGNQGTAELWKTAMRQLVFPA